MSTEIDISLSDAIFKTFLKDSFSKTMQNWIINSNNQTPNQKLSAISNWYKSQRLVMVLGAGTSVPYNLPDWNTLLQKLLLLTLKSDDMKKDNKTASILAKTFSKIFEPNSLVSARYLHNYFKTKSPTAQLTFENAIREALYTDIKTSFDSELMKELRQFCIAAGKNPNLDAIITYNYDDIIEQCLTNIDVDIPFASIHARGMKYNQHQLPIYHVHGYLPRKGQLTVKNKIVLSEDEYHQQYIDVYSWSNLVQINKFRDFNCLFIGISFTDPNLRRLLDIAKNERGDDEIHHYCFRKKYNNAQIKKKLEQLLSENNELLNEKVEAKIELDDAVERLGKLMESFEEKDALSFGVGIIWINSYEEIPELLKQIRSEK